MSPQAMASVRWPLLVLGLSCLITVLRPAAAAIPSMSTPASEETARVPLYRTRTAASDLELGGDLRGVARGETRFVRYVDLLRLPQESFVAEGDATFGRPASVSGIPLERLQALLGDKRGGSGGSDHADGADGSMMTALSDDRYKANYPAAYLKAHHPVLVLRINGQPPERWPRSPDGAAMGPYLISHARFTPAFHVLSHAEEPQIPWGVVRIDLRSEAEVYAGIRPEGPSAKEQRVQQGFRIAGENCFRCHNQGAEGGMKALRPWQFVAQRSVADPEYFNRYVTNPRAIDPKSQMAASPNYDAATLAALRAYFGPFAEASR